MKVGAAYIRVSSDDQTEYSPDSQVKEIKNYAARHDIFLPPENIFIDAGISGRKANKRPEFQRMVSAAKNKPKPFDVILVWKFSRFARNQEESILYKSLLKRECGIEVTSITEETGDNMFGSLIERIIEWMDEFYSIRLGEEVRAKMTFVAEQGKMQTTASFGYSKKPDEELKILPDEANWVRFMAEQFLNKKSLRSIANHLNANGIRTHRGNKFEARTVEYILKNMTNAGAVHWTPNQAAHDSRHPYSDNTIIVKDVLPAIYSFEQYEEIMKEFDRRTKSRTKYAKSDTVKKHWLSGYLKCSNCGATLIYSKAHNGFQCYKYGKSLCSVSHYVSASKIEVAVIEALSEVTVTDTFIKAITKPTAKDSIDYTKDIERLENMLVRAKKAYVEGIDSIEEYAVNKERISKEISQLKQKESERIVEYPPKTDVVNKFKTIIDLIKSDADNDAKRAAFGEIVEKVIYSKPEESVKIFFYL